MDSSAYPTLAALLVPLACAALLGALGRWLRAAAPWIALAGPLAVLAVGAWSLASGEYRGLMWPWMEAGGSTVRVGLEVLPLSAVMLVVVGLVAGAVVVFSAGYMRGDRGFARYFALLSLFTAAMTLLVLSSSIVALFVGWELVGACSYLLIGFWYHKPEAAEAARKAFLVTRVGDVGFLLGIAVLWQQTGTVSIAEILDKVGAMPAATVTVVALLLFAGAAGKSAQFPLHVWLPDAMEGPTPVSALIHAATMVAAGVFLVARMWPLFAASGVALSVVLTVGTFTALGAATVAVAQTDIKKVLAYSTLSQLGFMFAALGAGAWGAAIFHLVTHAAFKALLFLSAGSVIHGSDTQELAKMGGLRRFMPVTAGCWIAGALALAGIPPLSGFFSKDAVLASVLHASPVAGIALVIASVLTGLYVARTTQLAFFGEYRGEAHPHESGAVMTVPLVLLAAAAAGAGFAQGGLERVLGLEPEALVVPVAATAVGAGLLGLAVGWTVWRRDPAAEAAFPAWAGRVWKAMHAAYGYDGLLSRVFVSPVMAAADALHSAVDRQMIDGAVEGIGRAARAAGSWMSKLSNGDGQMYAKLIGIGAMCAIALAAWLGR